MARISIIGWIVKKLKGNIALVEDSSTASQNISANQYVNFQGELCTADAAISQGDTLATSGAGKNLTEVTGGGLNALNDHIATKTLTPTQPVVSNVTVDSVLATRTSNIVIITINLTLSATFSNWTTVLSGLPKGTWTEIHVVPREGSGSYLRASISNNGDFSIRNGSSGAHYYFQYVYSVIS